MDGFLSAAACRLVVFTGKSKFPIHPKHLISEKVWFDKYLSKTDVLLDLGCGTGKYTIQAAKKVKQAVGVDIDQKLLSFGKELSQAKKIKNIKFLTADLNKRFPFDDDYFHKIICNDVLEHLNKRDFALKEIKRILRKDGLLFLVTDNPDNSWKKMQKKAGLFYYADSDHKYEYPKEEIIKKLEQLNFKIVSVSTVTYETPLKGFIDLSGGFSLTLYKKLRKWREKMNQKYPEETVGFRIVAKI